LLDLAELAAASARFRLPAGPGADCWRWAQTRQTERQIRRVGLGGGLCRQKGSRQTGVRVKGNGGRGVKSWLRLGQWDIPGNDQAIVPQCCRQSTGDSDKGLV
jgi:hypothetical protein